jgi:hypothetical protein
MSFARALAETITQSRTAVASTVHHLPSPSLRGKAVTRPPPYSRSTNSPVRVSIFTRLPDSI